MNATLRTTHLHVEGMTCGSCVRHVTAALRSLPGVASADVRLREGAAHVRHDPAQATVPALLAALATAGYPGRVDAESP
jgi:copper chaperone